MRDLYRCPGSIRDAIDKSLTWDSVFVADEDVPAMLKAGWHESIAAASVAPTSAPQEVEVPQFVPSDDAPPTRDELERKARDMGLKFDGRTSDRKLAAMIADAL